MTKTSEDIWDSITAPTESRRSGGYDGVERRQKPRVYEPFFTVVRGVDGEGKSIEVNTLLDNISASGLYMRLAKRVKLGERLFMIIHLPSFLPDEQETGRIAAMGVVLRSEQRSGDLCGLAIRFIRHRFL